MVLVQLSRMLVIVHSWNISAKQEDAVLYFIKISRTIPRADAGKVLVVCDLSQLCAALQ